MTLPTYQYSGVCYVATAGQTTFALTTDGGNAINYANPSHIKVKTSADNGDTWTDLDSGTDWLFADPPVSIVLNSAVDAGVAVDIYRQTPLSQDFIKFEDGNLLTAGQLNDFDDWQLYIDQEIADRVENLTAPDINLADTDDLPEGSVNLYYTDARVKAWIDSNLSDTDDLSEGSTNLYYTDARVESYVSGAGYIKDAGVTKIIAGNSNITISPDTGVGEVTISASGGGGGEGGIPEAPTDGQVYGRRGSDNSWVVAGGGGDENVQSDWNQTDDTKDDYIKNKPTIPSAQNLQSVCDEGSVTTTTIQAAGYRIDQLTPITSTSP